MRPCRKLTWSFDLPGIDDLYKSYEATDLWRFLSQPAQGITVNFVQAQRSAFKWTPPVVEQIRSLGHQVRARFPPALGPTHLLPARS